MPFQNGAREILTAPFAFSAQSWSFCLGAASGSQTQPRVVAELRVVHARFSPFSQLSMVMMMALW